MKPIAVNVKEPQGSITAIWLVVIAAFFFVGVVVLEREWVNYQLRLVEQAVDLASEAGAYDHEVQVTVSATLTRVIIVEKCEMVYPEPPPPPAEPFPPFLDCHDEEKTETEIRTYEGPLYEVEETKWKAHVGCDVDGWICSDPKVDQVCVTAGPNYEIIATETFRANWRGSRASRLVGTHAMVQLVPAGGCSSTSAGLQVTLRANYTLKPFFGMLPLEQELVANGSAAVKVKPPVLSL